MLGRCLDRDPDARPTVKDLLEHPFLTKELPIEVNPCAAPRRATPGASTAGPVGGADQSVPALLRGNPPNMRLALLGKWTCNAITWPAVCW